MPAIATHADALRLEVSDTEIRQLAAAGALPGVSITHAAGRNGPGVGRLQDLGGGGTAIRWRAPGSSTYGPAVDVSAGGSFLVEDGEDRSKFLRVAVAATHLSPGPSEARVYLADRYQNGTVDDDVTAAEATAGDVGLYRITCRNASATDLSNLVVWLDAAGDDYLEISVDEAAYSSPTTEATALSLGHLLAGEEATLYLKRTIPASTSSDADVLTHLHFAFQTA